MELRIEVPDLMAEMLGPDPERGALEALVAELVFNESISIGFAGDVLGMTSVDALDWYVGRGHEPRSKTDEEIESDIQTWVDYERRRRGDSG